MATSTGIFIMCACGCFVVAAVAAALVYSLMHGLWPAVAAILLFTAVLGYLAKKFSGAGKPRPRH